MSLLEAVNFKPKGLSFHLDRAFPCFTFPESWPNPQNLILPQQINCFTLGWYPTRTSQFLQDPGHQYHDHFYKLQQHSRMVALGEIGLDYEQCKSSSGQQHQQDMLEYLCLYQHTKDCPILLHCRDPPGMNQALLDTLAILKQRVSPTTRIYLHCYSYGWEEFSHWNMTFQNLFICLTPKVLSPKDQHPNLISFIKGLEPNRLLLETDAPYFGLHTKGYQKGAPSQVFAVAKQVAEWCSSTPGTVLRDSAAATFQFYRLNHSPRPVNM